MGHLKVLGSWRQHHRGVLSVGILVGCLAGGMEVRVSKRRDEERRRELTNTFLTLWRSALDDARRVEYVDRMETGMDGTSISI